MKKKDKLVYSAIAAFLAITSANASFAASPATETGTEKCYGLVKAGMNDCATSTASCAGSATKDKQPDAFLLMPKGICDKLVGGSLTPGK